MRSTVISLLALMSMVLTMPALASNKKHEQARKSVFILYGRSAERGIDHTGLCTAFIYGKGQDGYYLLTEGHCFSPDAPSDAVYLVSEGQAVENPVNLQPVQVLNHIDDGDMDVAELYLKTDKEYPVLELDDKPTHIDQEVFYVGYPELLAQTVYLGRVASDPIQVNPRGCENICKGRILIQTGGGPGASGSPIIDSKSGKVVGILEGHQFENGVVAVPSTLIESYYAKNGHSMNSKYSISPKVRSEVVRWVI